MKKPVIGITLDWEDVKTYSIHQSWYALRDNYVSVISQFGGVPVLIPYDIENIDKYVDMIDALVITGGQLVLSGILYEQAEAVINAYQHHIIFNPLVQQEDWIRLDGIKR